MSADELERAMKEAWSIKEDMIGLIYIGSIQKGERVFCIYKDKDRNYFYETKYKTKHGLITEEERVFGKNLKKGHSRKWQYGNGTDAERQENGFEE